MASSPTNDISLKKHFNNTFKGGTLASSVESVVEWLRKMDVFKALNILEADFRKACRKLKEKAVITFEDFQRILVDLAQQNEKDLDELKRELVEQMENFDKAESRFREELKKGQASVEEAMEWLKRHQVLEKAKLAEAEVKHALNKAKESANTIDYDKFVKEMKEVATKNKAEFENIFNNLLDPGFLPKVEEGKDGKGKEK